MNTQSLSNIRRDLTRFAGQAASVLLVLQTAPSTSTVAQSGVPANGSISDVTIALTLSWTRENAVKASGTTQTKSGTSVSATLGNKDFLQYMKDNGRINDTTIAGWKIVYVSSEYTSGLFATKSGKTPVEVPAEVITIEGSDPWGGNVYGEAETYTETFKADKLVSSSLTGRYLGWTSGILPAGTFKGCQFKAQGMYSNSWSRLAGKVPETSLRYIKLAGLTGAVDSSSLGEKFSLWELPIVEGSISVGAGVPAIISAYSAVKN
jgi:hypothetical protein